MVVRCIAALCQPTPPVCSSAAWSYLCDPPSIAPLSDSKAGAVGAAELAMYAALMTSNTNVAMVEYLMAGMWVLLKHPSNRAALGGAFSVNPAASALTRGMMDKLQDTIDVADVNDTVSMLL